MDEAGFGGKKKIAEVLLHNAWRVSARTVYYGIRGHRPRPRSPPRKSPSVVEPDVPFDFVFLDLEHRAFPVLVPKAA